MEICIELSEIYQNYHEIRLGQVQIGGVQMTKEWLKEQNKIGKEMIKYSQYLAEMILKCANKFDYLQTILNMQLKSANMYSKMVASKKEKQVEYIKLNLECHKKARAFVNEYKQEKKLQDKDLDPVIQE